MEGTLGEIRAFAGTFAPANWKFCDGSTLSISEYSTLFAIIGTIYGGDGSSTFQLPNFQSRVVIGAGQGTGLPNYVIGQSFGEEAHTLTSNEMPMHTHVPTVQTDTTPSAATLTLMGIDNAGGQLNPQGNYLGQDTDAGTASYAPGTTVASDKMNAGSIQINTLFAPLPSITLSAAGSSMPHSNIQPVMGINYIICINGLFPSRD
jgi:microcystin-dependent protein